MNIPTEDLCKNLPEEIAFYMNYVKNLGFDEAPNYKMLYTNFQELYQKWNFKYDYKFDWT